MSPERHPFGRRHWDPTWVFVFVAGRRFAVLTRLQLPAKTKRCCCMCQVSLLRGATQSLARNILRSTKTTRRLLPQANNKSANAIFSAKTIRRRGATKHKLRRMTWFSRDSSQRCGISDFGSTRESLRHPLRRPQRHFDLEQIRIENRSETRMFRLRQRSAARSTAFPDP